MMLETEEDHLDQSLRDTFSDFNLPPSRRLWPGIEEQLASLPAPARSGPRAWLLPVVGLLGLTVGWLLPRPAPRSAGPRPNAEVPAATRVVFPPAPTNAFKLPVARPAPAQAPKSAAYSANESGVLPAAVAGQQRVARKAAGYQQRQKLGAAAAAGPVAELILPPEWMGEQLPASPVELEGLPTPASVNLPQVQAAKLWPDAAPEHSITANHLAAPKPTIDLGPSPLKIEGLRERRPGYRLPTHRLAERGRGVRRIQNGVVRHWQRVFEPRRARAAAQPDF